MRKISRIEKEIREWMIPIGIALVISGGAYSLGNFIGYLSTLIGG